MRFLLLPVLAILASAALAETPAPLPTATPGTAQDTPMTASQFEAYALGKTLYYAVGGQNYGAETYLPDHKVIWAFLGQECKRGTWYTDPSNHICFTYDDETLGPQCWSFYATGTGIAAHFDGITSNPDLVEVRQSDKPLICPGPRVGA